jgi:hypothetical protein
MPIAGSALNISASFIVPINSDLNSMIVDWRITDEAGSVYASGVSSSFTSTPTTKGLRLSFIDSTTLPSSMDEGDYNIEWYLQLEDGNHTSIKTITVEAVQPDYLGAEDSVELLGDVSIFATLPTATASVDIYKGNTLVASIPSTSTTVNSEGYEHEVTFDSNTYSLVASLEPYNLVWKFVTTRNENSRVEWNVQV